MSAPFFSILIANYNNGCYLHEAIQSILAQTYTDWEIILVDDCSTDGLSRQLYEEYASDQRIHIYHNVQNQGCGFTKRRCAELAKGQWCCYLDPDDKLRAETLSIFAQHISQQPTYKAFFSHMYVCDENMHVVFDNTYAYATPAWNEFVHFQKAIPCFMFATDTYRKTIGIDASLVQSVDIDLYYKMAEQTDFFYIDLPLYYYRNNPHSISKNKNIATATHLWVMLSSLARQGASPEFIRQEIAAFWLWREREIQEELYAIKQSRWYRYYHLWKSLKNKIR